MSKKISVKERIRRAEESGGGYATRTVTVWLGADLDLIAEYETAVGQLDDPPTVTTRKLDENPRAAIEARVAELREQLDEFRFEFVLRGLGSKRYERLTAEHPPRKTDDGDVEPRDQNAGWNVETFPGALIRAATVSPDLDDDDWRGLLGDDDVEGMLTSAQVDQLALAAWRLSKLPVDVPFWSAASPTTPRS